LADWAMFQTCVMNYASKGTLPQASVHVYLHHGPTST